MGPKCNHKCPDEREEEEGLTTRGEGDGTTEAETGIMQPAAKEHLLPLKVKEGKDRFSL